MVFKNKRVLHSQIVDSLETTIEKFVSPTFVAQASQFNDLSSASTFRRDVTPNDPGGLGLRRQRVD